MECPHGIARVILVVLDGLRADATPLFRLPQLTGLAERGARTFSGRTVSPSITAAAMTSLFTGVAPHTHGIASDRWGFPRSLNARTLLPPLLRTHGHRVRAFMSAIPRAYCGLATRMAQGIGVEATFAGETAHEILDSAWASLRGYATGVTLLHWPDADRAGHAEGWASRAYVRAAHDLDDALARLVQVTGVEDDPASILIAFADHGGGGADPKDHESSHMMDVSIPLVVAGGQIVTGELAPFTSLLDIPPTVAWALGVMPPAEYAGRILVEAFVPSRSNATVSPGKVATSSSAAT